MRNVTFCTIIAGGLFCSCVTLAQEKPAPSLDQQFKALAEEIETWKKDMSQNLPSRGSIETLLRQGVAFQKSYAAETDSIVKADLLDEYVKQRDSVLTKIPVTLFLSYGTYSYPSTLTFEKDDLEVDAKRPFLFQRRADGLETTSAKRRMVFSYKESQRFANLLGRLVAKAKAKEPMSVSMRDLVASVQVTPAAAHICLQFKTPTGTVPSELYRLPEFDARLLIARIEAALEGAPPPAGYREPDDLDPATALFSGTAAEPAKGGAPVPAGADAEAVSANALSFDVRRITVTQGQRYSYTNLKVNQQFDYRVLFRWSGAQPLNVQVVMYLVSPVKNKLSIVGRGVQEMTVETGRAQEMLISAEQKVPGTTAGTVIVQCFSGGRLLKSYSSNAQHKKFADMADIESQLPALYLNPTSIYQVLP